MDIRNLPMTYRDNRSCYDQPFADNCRAISTKIIEPFEKRYTLFEVEDKETEEIVRGFKVEHFSGSRFSGGGYTKVYEIGKNKIPKKYLSIILLLQDRLPLVEWEKWEHLN